MDGIDVQVHEHLSDTAMAAIAGLLDRAGEAQDQPALSDHQLSAFTHRHADLTAITAMGTTPEALLGYGQLSRSGGAWELALVVEASDGGGRASGVTEALLLAGTTTAAARGGGHVIYWAPRPSDELDAIARRAGFVGERELLQLRVDLPLGEVADSARVKAAGLNLRSFKPGVDEGEWVAVNNRAFAGHPEQGGWDIETLVERESESWFDPEGFVVLEESGRLVGSCWTKVHGGSQPPLGEIYVISVDPDDHGRGLGRLLTVAGLDRLASSGLRNGMLYVDRANDAALTLYHSLGFVDHHLERAYGADVAPLRRQ